MSKFNFGLISSAFQHLPNLIVIALLVVGGLFAYQEFRNFKAKLGFDLDGIKDARFDNQQRQLDALNRQYLQLDDHIARGQTNIVSREELERIFKRTIDSRIQDIVKQNKEQVVALGKAIAQLGRNLEMDITPDGQFRFLSRTGEEITIENVYVYADSQDGERGIRLAQVVFDFSDTTFTINTDALKIEANSVRTQQPTGTFNHYVELSAYNPRDSRYRTSPYKLNVDTVVVHEVRQQNNHLFFPRFHLEGGLGSNFFIGSPTVGFDLGVSLAAYGRTAHDNYLRFLRLGIGLTDDTDRIFGSFSPIGLNVRTLRVPFLEDTWIFPGVSLQKSGTVGFSTSLSTTF